MLLLRLYAKACCAPGILLKRDISGAGRLRCFLPRSSLLQDRRRNTLKFFFFPPCSPTAMCCDTWLCFSRIVQFTTSPRSPPCATDLTGSDCEGETREKRRYV